MKFFLFGLAAAFCGECQLLLHQVPTDSHSEIAKLPRPTTCQPRDTITALNTSVCYVAQAKGFKISWGDGQYRRLYDSLYTCEDSDTIGLWNDIPSYYAETPNTLVFVCPFARSSGGNPIPINFYALVLPKNQQDSVYTRENFLRAKGNYLVYCQNEFEPEKLVVQNLETKRTQRITLRPKPLLFRVAGLSINDVKIANGIIRVVYTYKVVDTHKEDDPLKDVAIEKTFHLSI